MIFIKAEFKSMVCILAFLFISSQASALGVQVTGRNGEPLLTKRFWDTLPLSVGKVSVSIFEQFETPFEGDHSGISSLFGVKQELEIVSETEMKAWGWCFALDGLVPETLTDDTFVTSDHAVLEWFFGYAHFQDGVWTGQCLRP